MGGSQTRIRSGKLRILGNGALEECSRLRIIRRCEPAIALCPAHVVLPGFCTRCVWASHVLFLRGCQLHRQRSRDHPSDFSLNGEDIVQVPVVGLSPHVITRRAVDELRGDPDTVIGRTDPPFEHVPHPQLSTHLLRLDCPSLVRECRGPCDDREPVEPRELRDEIFGHPVTEVLLLGVPTHVDKREDSNGRLGGRGRQRAGHQLPYAHASPSEEGKQHYR